MNLLARHVLVFLALLSTACVKDLLVDGQIQSTRQASSALDGIGDYELARTAVRSGIAQFEGMHALAPRNADALFLLTKSWASYGFAFLEDDLQAAQDAGDDARVEALRASAHAAYDRAIGYGQDLLALRDGGFARSRTDAGTFSRWLADRFTRADDAPGLLWTGTAWLARVNVMRGEDDGPAYIGEAWIGAALLARSLELDPSVEHFAGLATMAAYDSSNGLAPLARGKAKFEQVRARTHGQNLLALFLYASTYACVKSDRRLYESLLTGVVRAPDASPEQSLENAIARRRALRWLGTKRAKDTCGIDAPAARQE